MLDNALSILSLEKDNSLIKYASQELKGNKDFIGKMIDIFPASIYYAKKELRDDYELGLKAVKALVNADKTPIGWAVLGKPSMMFFISSLTKVYLRISVSNCANCCLVGNSPKITK